MLRSSVKLKTKQVITCEFRRENMNFYICNHCKNIIGKVHDSGVPVVCCGEKMALLVPNTTDAATEKNVLVISVDGCNVTVTIGSTAHPMTEEHLIQWVYLETEEGGQKKALKAGDSPVVRFAITDTDKVKAAYAYCNLHGLWKAEV